MSAGRTLLRGALGVGALQVASMAVTFGSAVLLARVLGEDGFGAYSYATTWNLVLLAPASLGVGPIVTRETAAGLEKGEHGRVRALRSFALRAVAIGGLAVAALGVPLVWALRGQLDPLSVGPMLLAVPGTALSAAMLVARHHLLGLREVVVAQVAESLLRPLLVLGGVGLALALGWPVDPTWTTGWYVAGSALGLVFLGWRIRAATPSAVRTAAADPDPGWLRSSAPVLLTAVARDLNAEGGMLILGSMLPSADVGLFRAATRLASLPSTVLAALNLSFQPVAARLFAAGDLAEIERLGVRASRIAVGLASPLVLVFLLAGGPVLGVFGPAFSAAAPALAVLTLGHLFNVACGSVGVILVACRREDDAARGLVLSAVISLALNVALVWWLGLVGAAIATALGLVVWNVALSWFTWARLGILPAAFSWRR